MPTAPSNPRRINPRQIKPSVNGRTSYADGTALGIDGHVAAMEGALALPYADGKALGIELAIWS